MDATWNGAQVGFDFLAVAGQQGFLSFGERDGGRVLVEEEGEGVFPGSTCQVTRVIEMDLNPPFGETFLHGENCGGFGVDEGAVEVENNGLNFGFGLSSLGWGGGFVWG